jgi:WhiB family redox-sensing transcriptional regulator
MTTTEHTGMPPKTDGVPAVDWTRAACLNTAPRDGTLEAHRWFPERTPGATNAAHAEKACCSTCTIRDVCLQASVARNEPAGIWGGAGELERRFLRRAWVADGRTAGSRYELQVGLFFDRLEAQVAGAGEAKLTSVPDRNGPGAVDGRLSTYAKGRRNAPCKQAASFNAVLGAITTPKRKRVAA